MCAPLGLLFTQTLRANGKPGSRKNSPRLVHDGELQPSTLLNWTDTGSLGTARRADLRRGRVVEPLEAGHAVLRHLLRRDPGQGLLPDRRGLAGAVPAPGREEGLDNDLREQEHVHATVECVCLPWTTANRHLSRLASNAAGERLRLREVPPSVSPARQRVVVGEPEAAALLLQAADEQGPMGARVRPAAVPVVGHGAKDELALMQPQGFLGGLKVLRIALHGEPEGGGWVDQEDGLRQCVNLASTAAGQLRAAGARLPGLQLRVHEGDARVIEPLHGPEGPHKVPGWWQWSPASCGLLPPTSLFGLLLDARAVRLLPSSVADVAHAAGGLAAV
mmetsp:Transcript_56761/g.182316  ORF Transcript_56761/g.182316 Transcript_56761/m.182316 type:complete len:334 (+) Transcript_56761:40-1041(+)